MSFTRCRGCGHYDDVHAMGSPVSICFAHVGYVEDAVCRCEGFIPMTGGPEGTDIYRGSEPVAGPGYHLVDIPKGEIGEASKIEEEFQEFQDALTQGAVVMQLCELSDMLGAIDAWLTKHHPSVKLEDLLKMSELTRRAFTNGKRK